LRPHPHRIAGFLSASRSLPSEHSSCRSLAKFIRRQTSDLAAHVRSSSNRKHTTVREHTPSSHQRYVDWTLERMRRQAGATGRHTSALVEIVLRARPHATQCFRACVGRAGDSYDNIRGPTNFH
jgi:hypothetical protein